MDLSLYISIEKSIAQMKSSCWPMFYQFRPKFVILVYSFYLICTLLDPGMIVSVKCISFLNSRFKPITSFKNFIVFYWFL